MLKTPQRFFCMNIYNSELLHLSNKYMNTIYITYRKAPRCMFKLPFHKHNFTINGLDDTIEIRLHKKSVRFTYNLLNSSNNVICNAKAFRFNNYSILSEKFQILMLPLQGDYMTIFDWHVNVDVIMKHINNYYIKLTEEHVVIIENVQNLIELRDDLTSRSDISKLLFELCCK